jgi:hypothetical protein
MDGMDLDGILHEKKNFAELDDSDIEAFLQRRRFNSEHLNLEFKREFPTRKGGKFDQVEICSYIAGFSNSEGGVIVYGVGDEIKDAAVAFPSYVHGVSAAPSREDLSEWAKNYIAPLVQSPAIREFTVNGKRIWVLKVPVGRDLPYLVCPPGADRLFSLWVKTAGGVTQLTPSQIKDFYRRSIIGEAKSVLRWAGQAEETPPGQLPKWVAERKAHQIAKLEDPKTFGYVGIYCRPSGRQLNIQLPEIEKFYKEKRWEFSEAMRHSERPTVEQRSLSAGYYPTAIRNDIKSTTRVTFYTDGVVAFDSQLDTFMDRDPNIVQPYWLAYEVQRHLQLTKAFLEPYGVTEIECVVDLDYVRDRKMVVGPKYDRAESAYTGKHVPIVKAIQLTDIHGHGDKTRNVASPATREIMDEISHIFGFSKMLGGVWDDTGYLHYVRGLENLR